MGGDYYERDVEVVAPNNVAGYSVAANQILTQNKGLHKSMNPARFANQHLRSTHKNPIIFALDVTGSMGDWTKVIFYFSLHKINIRLYMINCQCSMVRS